MTAEELADRVTADVPQGTSILDLSVTASDPKQAQRIAATLAERLTSAVARLETAPSQDSAPVNLTVVDPARLPTEPESPRPLRDAGIALAIGLALGLSGAFLRELLDSSVRSQDDVAEITHLPLLARVVDDPALVGYAHMRHFDGPSGSVARPLSALGSSGEAFRALSASIQYAELKGDGRVLTVTSPSRAEGKTTTAVGLASALAEGGHSVILIDADFRQVGLSDFARLEGGGLTSILTRGDSLAETVRSTSVPNLAVLPTGELPINPSELLQSPAMLSVLKEASMAYDMVVLDSPPVLSSIDASLLAAASDSAVVVLRHGKTASDQLRATLAQLASVDARVVGVVLNRVPRREDVARNPASPRWSFGR